MYFKFANVTSQSTQILPELVQKMQQMQPLIAQMQTQLNINNKMLGMKTAPLVATRVTRYHFGKNLLFESWCMQYPRECCRSNTERYKRNVTFDKQLNESDLNFHHRDKKKMPDSMVQTVK